MSETHVRYTSWAELPLDTPVLMTEFVEEGGFEDYGEFLYCSHPHCGIGSARRRRAELWAIRRERARAHEGHTRTYCSDHLPGASTSPSVRKDSHPVRERATCPVHGIELPLTGICDDCA